MMLLEDDMKLPEWAYPLIGIPTGIFLFGYLPLKLLGALDVRPFVQAERNRYVQWEHDCDTNGGQVVYIHNSKPICMKKGTSFMGQYR